MRLILAAFVLHSLPAFILLRIRPGQKKSAAGWKPDDAGLPYSRVGDCIALPNSTKIDSLLVLDKEVVAGL